MIWFREMGGLIRDYWQTDRAYRAALKQLKKQIKEQAHGRLH